MKGADERFIVIEGLDGSGKSTQIDLLLAELKKRGRASEYLHFPRTGIGYYGDLVARFLRGDLGPLESVNPYLVALIYAGDRYDSRDQIRGWLERGVTVVADRYVISNIAFQCAKLESAAERKELRKWILDFEYDHHSIPRPDINIFLDVPFHFTERKLKSGREGADRAYLNGKLDIHEQDLEFQQKVRQVYLEQAALDPGMRVVNCAGPDNEMLPPGEVFFKIKNILFQ